ncbi:TIM barrel protein [Pseudotenacibaculum haliotis]|uniref:TIM barrel protein n=1 Tax=Pseudotenacibaculum haliotis TaxID=1862138 RepID=A0ABW5LWB4_9FLAO
MIFVSTSCVKNSKIRESVLELAQNGFKNIELSGGTDYYEGFEEDLIDLKERFNLNYICHNYFPPPKDPFVVNLASLDDEVHQKTFDHLTGSLKLTEKLNCDIFGFHAGFYLNIPIREIGKEINKNVLFDKKLSFERFCKSYKELQSVSNVKLYIENNVISYQNYTNFKENFFMLTNKEEYLELSEKIDFELLLDVAHLKVSCNSLNLDFEEELDFLMSKSNYIHISDNDSFADTNKAVHKDSHLYELLSKHSFKDKTVTLEVYDNIDSIKNTYELINNL